MRILHVIHSMSPASGGPAGVVRELAQAAQTAPEGGGIYEAEVVSLDDPKEGFLKSEAFPIHGVGPGVGKYGFTLRMDRWLADNLSRFDGVIVNGLWQYHGYAAWKACRGTKPYLVFPHGMLDPWFKTAYPAKHLKKALYWALAERRLLRDATAVMFTSATEAQLAPQSFRRSEWKGRVVPYGTVAPGGDRDLQVERFYAACPGVREGAFLLFVGRLHKKKGIDLLIPAFSANYRDDPQMHLVIAGPDEEGLQPVLSSLAKSGGVGDRVHFPGMLRGDEKWGAFRAAEAFALPSHQENFGVVVAEALACGTPVLISDKVNIWQDIVEDGVGLVEADDLPGTTRLLARWRALGSAARGAMAAKCLPCFQRRYDVSELPRILADVLRLG
jgi:glycosyltransferase involved in cell wall biosynthesis